MLQPVQRQGEEEEEEEEEALERWWAGVAGNVKGGEGEAPIVDAMTGERPGG